ncbi:MAG: response regulator transcription factor [Nitrospira sp.]|jgi:DNA-binding response OmpR family regulator|nr:response regulator transcription factor [Nitrospira sp.]
MSVTHQPGKPTLLMAEDEEDTASLLRFLLERSGYQVVHAPDGKQAQQLIDTMPTPNLVLLDIMLPHMSGLQLLPYIRKKPEWKQVPIIMLTADSSEHDIQQALASGANDYMVKPFNPRELSARLSRFLKPAV